MHNDQDIARIKEIVEDLSRRYQAKDGAITFAGIDGGTVKVAPAGFCWR
jgi:hypothetical protein